jgi:putative ABC transport system permease protein
MSLIKLIIASLKYYRKQHLGIFATAMLATAVLTGALITGDSVVSSLKHLVEIRLGKAQYVIHTGDRYITIDLANELRNKIDQKLSAAILLETVAINNENGLRKNKVNIVGIDSVFSDLSIDRLPYLKNSEVIISENLADALSIDSGDYLLLRINKTGLIPVNAPFSDKKDINATIRVQVIDIASDRMLGKFSLKNDQKPPYNIFISRSTLATKTGLDDKSNCILVQDGNNVDIDLLETLLRNTFSLEDAGLNITSFNNAGFTDITSQRIFIDAKISKDISSEKAQNVLTYFANTIEKNNNKTPYSFISAVSDNFFEKKINDNEIIISDWLAEDINANIGDTLNVSYFKIDRLNNISEDYASFVVSDVINTDNLNFRSLMPEFPGLSDAASCGDWETDIPIDFSLIRDKDEDYWNQYKGTPKAFISLKKGQEIWGNNYGDLTLIRFPDTEVNQIITKFKVSPDALGFRFEDMKIRGNEAAANGVDFGQLFLSLSFFIIFSSVLLIILIINLNLQSRQWEIGIYKSLGFRRKTILKLRLLENIIPILFASILGSLLGIAYNKIVILALNSVWNDAIHADMILVSIIPSTVITGAISGIIISFLTLYFPIRASIKKSAIQSISATRKYTSNNNRILSLAFLISSLITLYLIAYKVFLTGSISPTIVLSGAFMLIVSLILLYALLLNYLTNKTLKRINLTGLSLKNITRNKSRSIASVAMLSIGIFTIFVTGANRLTFTGTESEPSSGTGSFSYWIESTIPLPFDLNTTDGKQEYGLDPKTFDSVDFIQISKLEGDDASCLNLNQIQLPSVLGIDPYKFDSLQLFGFATNLYESNNPWLELTEVSNDSIIPVIADQTVIQWGLIKKIGDTIEILNEFGKPLKLVLTAGLKPSIFQGHLLMYDSLFQVNFPSSDGTDIVLVKNDNRSDIGLVKTLKNRLKDYGIEITGTSDRLRSFYSVTNTYLTIFLFLGGLGILIGTIGFGLIIMRNVIDRKSELSTYLALGFTKRMIFVSILIENFVIFLIGLIIGTVSSIVGILPSIMSQSYDISFNTIIIILLIIIVNTLFWITIPTWLFTRRLTTDTINLLC